MSRSSARDVEVLEFTLAGKVLDELVDWHNWRGRAAVAEGVTRPAGRGTRTLVRMRRDDARDLIRYFDWLLDAVASLDPDQRRGVDMMPVRRCYYRLRRLVEVD